MTISVCTLAHGRDGHLTNLVRALDRSSIPPNELVIAVMQDEPYVLPETRFPIRQLMIEAGDIPLAEARNTAARAARGQLLVFLDVDCIPHPELIADYARFGREAIAMGEVLYLPKDCPTSALDFASFDRMGVEHSERPGPPDAPFRMARDYRVFWSLNFALPAPVFAAIGGFDETFTGYGGEDTDFARQAVERGVDLYWLRGARAYHQYHPHHMPPVHHLDSVLANAHRFAEKWGHPTMQHWLRAFVLMGLAERTERGWRKLREPSEADLALTRQQEDQPYASSAAVLDWLEARAERAGSEPIAAA